MARSLTSGATTAKNARATTFTWLVESTALSVHWATGVPGSTGGFTWERRIHTISEIELSVPPLGGLASAQTVTITVVESTTGSSLRALLNTYGKLEGADITVSLLFAGEAYADRIQRFTGVIDHVQWSAGLQGGLGQIIAVDKSVTSAPVVPSAIFTAAEYSNLASGLAGQFKPILYCNGDIPYVPLHLINTATNTWLAASHALDALPAIQVVTPGAEGGLFQVSGDCTSSPSAGTLTGNRPLSQALFSGGTATRSIHTQVNTNSPSNLIDSNNGTFAYIYPNTADSNGEGTASIGVACVWGATTAGMNEVEITLVQLKRALSANVSSTLELIVDTIDAASKAQLIAAVAREGPWSWGTNYRDLTIVETGLAFGGTVGLEILLKLTREGGATADLNYRWDCAEIYAVGRFRPANDFHQLFSGNGVGGLEDTDGHITGSAGAALTRAADVIRSVLERYLSLSVDTASFTTARAVTVWDGAFWRLAFGLGAGWPVAQLDAPTLLHQLTFQTQFFLFPSGAGTFKLLSIADTPTSQYSFTVSTMDNVVVETSRMESVYHTYTIQYNWSPLTGEYTQIATASPGGSNHQNAPIAAILATRCADSFARYGELPPLVIQAWGVTERVNAEDLLEKLVTRHWSQSILVTWDSPFVGIHLEVGDGVTITHAELPTGVNGSVFRLIRITDHPEDASGSAFPLQLQGQSAPV